MEQKFFTSLNEKSHNNQNAPLDSKNYCSLEVTTLISMLGSDEAYKLSAACSTVLAAQVLTKLVGAFLISNKLKFHQAEVSFKKRIK